MKKTLFSLALACLGLLLVLTVPKAAITLPGSHHDATQIIGGAGGVLGLKQPTIWDIVRSREEFSNFQTAVEKADLAAMLDQKGPFTVFIPTDAGFAQLPSDTKRQVLNDPNASKQVVLNQTADGRLAYNVLEPQVGLRDLTRMGYIVTADGNKIPLTVEPRTIQVGKARLVEANIGASNGIIHVVDRVNLPPGLETMPMQPQESEGQNPE